MLKYLIVLTSICLVAVASVAGAESYNGVRCALTIHQWDSEQAADVLIWSDTADFLKGTNVSGFAVGISLDVDLADFDTAQVRMAVHATTFASQPDHRARNFQVEYGLPARLDNLIGKNGAQLRLTLVPLERVAIDTSWCPYTQHTVEDFNVDPSAHMNIYYVEQTLGDFHWNAIKGLLEEEYDNFAKMTNFNMPGKYMMYLCPCRLNTIIWDDRFGMMIDPTRSSMYAIYSKDYNSVYPFLISQAAIYHNYGYAPGFIADGFANYLSFAIYDMKKLKAEGSLVSVESLLDSYQFFKADPRTADRISATFVRYLIDQYRIGVFIDMYKQSDDLNLKAMIVEAYGKSISELETEWLHYVDTVSINFSQAGYYALQAEAMLDYSRASQYAGEMKRLATTRRDSLEALWQMTRSDFFQGDYYAAVEGQVEFLKLVDTVSSEWMKLAGYRMMSGEYEQAAADLAQATELDSAHSLNRFNTALNSLFMGDTLRARQFFSSIITGSTDAGGMVESKVMLAMLMIGSKDEADRALSLTYLNSVVATLTRQDRRHNPSSSQAMWLGIAYLGLNDTGNAEDQLQTAMFLETRAFYTGMISLWLGKVADVRGERAVARDYYQRVLAGAAAHYHQEEARRLLDTPYRQ